jgi:hypothetical protein
MCTVVCRWEPDATCPLQILALRDELASRSFDEPDRWWPDQPGVVGGRDRSAGGSWCVSDIAAGVTAVVLNRPHPRTPAPGAPSRGVLPLLAVRYGPRWPEHVEVTGMAGFEVVLAEPDGLRWWWYDGEHLGHEPLDAGTWMVKPRGLATDLDPRFERAGHRPGLDADVPAEQAWSDWLAVLRDARPSDDPSGLIVRRPVGADTYQTVFGQFIAARPGRLRVDYLRSPVDGTAGPWTTRIWSDQEPMTPRASTSSSPC